MANSKSSKQSETNPNVEQPETKKSNIQPQETTQPKAKYIPATGLEDYGRWKTMFQDRKANPNDPPFRRGRIWS
ncbi:MAG: cyanobactin biosynthesis PatC/TenC/TruC family protein [Microcystis sp. M015S2]|uniref:cyanobactin biosynthesis PatC/TenC/TruC family protein n=1 Tax=unclassified Microcystis TaxID=2643300 RepID=UPI0025886B8E|nr:MULTISPECIES: cyanobactin biosynthesis PatC/TenC/TruC family protein [unclassified Microcystis]MCA2710250.1 cyanobactin biosynthesis PatC/TenC/TruC family protein [Microcystis sp. M025S2]MCA2742636.1 cyanobactin biosynthesis PatC/TenC/TruC family protein [Microcystis sp. M015S2]MCA2761208.1 cyanobactin biosynthesis PatC/TenC/TruC family protein [Microcystis sp. M145S2]